MTIVPCLNHKVLCSHPSWRLQSAMKSFWQAPVWSYHTLWMSGCPLINYLVCMPSISGWCQRGFSPGWSPPKCGAKPELTSSLTLVRMQGDHANGYPHHRLIRWGETWEGDCHLLLQPGEGGAFGHASNPCSVGFTWAGCCGDENHHQFSILPTGILRPLFPQHSHPVRGHPNYPIATFMAMPVLAASLFLQPGHAAQEGERSKWAKDHPNHQGVTVGELLWEAPSIIPGASLAAALSPATSHSTYKDRGLQTNERLNFNTAHKQLQVVTWAKFQLEWELLCEQCKQDTK